MELKIVNQSEFTIENEHNTVENLTNTSKERDNIDQNNIGLMKKESCSEITHFQKVGVGCFSVRECGEL